MRKMEQYQDMIARLYPELIKDINGNLKEDCLTKPITFQVTDACNLFCKYCYQINKGTRSMKLEDAKKLIDMVLTEDPKMNGYITLDNSPAIVLEFIGGEPFLEAELMEKICDYFVDKAIELGHPYAERFCISVCSNGTLYRDPKVQHFLNKYRHKMSFSVTVDGNKELHDSCRVFADGSGSYDLAVDAVNDWVSKGYEMGSKITIAPANLDYLISAIKHMVDLGYEEINANCVYEKGWTLEHAQKFYKYLKEIADFWIENNLVETHYLALFEENFFKPKFEDDLTNWCGGLGKMLSMDPDGYLYPCIRYMESSLGNERPAIRIGSVDEGIAQTECTKNCIECLKAIDRRTQSTDECFYCPIADGCSWCSAYNYQETGTPDKRATYICEMHKARSLANVYFWNTYYRKNNIDKRMTMYCPKEWALKIISEDEYNMLYNLSL